FFFSRFVMQANRNCIEGFVTTFVGLDGVKLDSLLTDDLAEVVKSLDAYIDETFQRVKMQSEKAPPAITPNLDSKMKKLSLKKKEEPSRDEKAFAELKEGLRGYFK